MFRVASKWISKKNLTHFSPTLTSNAQIKSPFFNIKLYDKANIHLLDWPQDVDGIYAKENLYPLILNGAHHYIDNVVTTLKVLKIDNIVIPITINDGQYDNAYVCSPYSYYISYSQQSMGIIKNKWLRNTLKGLLWILSKGLPLLDLNKIVIVNNWLLSTNLYPKITSEQIKIIAKYLQDQFPSHTIVFRSISQETNPDHYTALKNNDFTFIAARQNFFTDTKEASTFERRIYKSDLKVMDTEDYEIADADQLSEDDIPRLLELYHSVYGSKYSNLHPELNQEYLKLALKHQMLHLKAIRKKGVIEGVVGYIVRNGIMTCPFFGYDKAHPEHANLYRILCTILMEHARKNQSLFHQSAGASTYKKIRKAQESIEYNAVYYHHLAFHRKLPWMMFRALFNTIGLYYMKKY